MSFVVCVCSGGAGWRIGRAESGPTGRPKQAEQKKDQKWSKIVKNGRTGPWRRSSGGAAGAGRRLREERQAIPQGSAKAPTKSRMGPKERHPERPGS